MNEVPETRESLLVRVKDPGDREAWNEFVRIYRPAVYRLARARGLQDADAQDLAQKVLLSVAGAIPDWQPDADGRFRHWLRKVAKNATINSLTRQPKDRGTGGTSAGKLLLAQCGTAERVDEIELEYQRQLYRRAAETVRSRADETTWLAFSMTMIDGQSVAVTADKLAISPGVVYAQRLQLTTIKLQYVEAKELARVLNELDLLGEATLSIHPDGRSITLRGPEDEISVIIKMAEVLDREIKSPAPTPAATQSADSSVVDRLTKKYGQSPEPTPEIIASLRKQYEAAENRIKALANQAVKSQDPESKATKQLRKDLQSAISEAFQSRQRFQLAQIAAHRAKLDQMWKRIARREEIANEIIGRRVDQLFSRQADTLAQAAAKQKGGVQIENIDNKAIVVRGAREDVDRVVKAMEQMEKNNSGTAGSETRRPATGPRPFIERTGDSLTVNADSPDHLNKIIDSMTKWAYGDGAKKRMVREADGRSVKFTGPDNFLDPVEELFTDMQNAERQTEAFKLAKDVNVRFFGPDSSRAQLTFGDDSFALPARFRLDSGQQIPLTISGIPSVRYPGFYAMLSIDELSDEAREFFQSSSLPVAISIFDAEQSLRGKNVQKSYYLHKTGDAYRIREYSDPTRVTGSRPGVRVAQLFLGNQKPMISTHPPKSSKKFEGETNIDANDCVVFVEAIIVTGDKDAAKKTAFYSCGSVIGDDGLFAVVQQDALSDKSLNLPRIESVIVKSSSGMILNDGRVVGYDADTGLVLMQSANMPAPALALNGPDVVAAQLVKCVSTFGSIADTSVSKAIDRAAGFPYFSLNGNSYAPGSPVLLRTTQQLVGVVAGDGGGGDTVVVPVETIRKLVNEFRQREDKDP